MNIDKEKALSINLKGLTNSIFDNVSTEQLQEELMDSRDLQFKIRNAMNGMQAEILARQQKERKENDRSKLDN